MTHGEPRELAGFEVWDMGLSQWFVWDFLRRVEFSIAWPAFERSLMLEKMDFDLDALLDW